MSTSTDPGTPCVNTDETLETLKEGSMKTRHLLLVALSLLMGWGTFGVAQAAAPRPSPGPSTTIPVVSFEAGDSPGNFFTCSNTGNSKSIGCVPQSIGGAGQKSLAVIAPGETVGFPTYSGEASTVHTALSLFTPPEPKICPSRQPSMCVTRHGEGWLK